MRLTAKTSRERGGLRCGVKARCKRYVYMDEEEGANGTKMTLLQRDRNIV